MLKKNKKNSDISKLVKKANKEASKRLKIKSVSTSPNKIIKPTI